MNDAKTLTGANVRKVLLDTDMDPRFVPKHRYSKWIVYKEADSWTVPLLTSLLELRQDNWEVVFDVEDELEVLDDRELNFMIEAVSSE